MLLSLLRSSPFVCPFANNWFRNLTGEVSGIRQYQKKTLTIMCQVTSSCWGEAVFNVSCRMYRILTILVLTKCCPPADSTAPWPQSVGFHVSAHGFSLNPFSNTPGSSTCSRGGGCRSDCLTEPGVAVRVLSRTLELGREKSGGGGASPSFVPHLGSVSNRAIVFEGGLHSFGQTKLSQSCKSRTINQLCYNGNVLESP